MAKFVVVEDNRLNLKLFTDLLEVNEHEVHSTQSGSDAFELISEIKPDVAIIDIQLPHTSGLEIVSQVRQSADDDVNSIPCIAVTAFAFKEDEQNILDAGFDMYLAKPIDVTSFYKAIDSVLEELAVAC